MLLPNMADVIIQLLPDYVLPQKFSWQHIRQLDLFCGSRYDRIFVVGYNSEETVDFARLDDLIFNEFGRWHCLSVAFQNEDG